MIGITFVSEEWVIRALGNQADLPDEVEDYGGMVRWYPMES